jgi:hypothetical protein
MEEQDKAKKSCQMGLISCPILLVAQTAIMEFQLPAYV